MSPHRAPTNPGLDDARLGELKVEFETTFIIVRGSFELRELVAPGGGATLAVHEHETYVPVERQPASATRPHHAERLAL